MSPSPSTAEPETRTPTQGNLFIVWLIAVHAGASLVAAFFSANLPAVSWAVLTALVLCQASLLGMWGGFGTTNWKVRLPSVAAGVIVLWILVGIWSGVLSLQGFLLVFSTTSVIAIVTCGVRWLKARLGRINDGGIAASAEGFQFTIKHLMFLTFVVACLVTVGKLLTPHLPPVQIMVVNIIVLGLCFVTVALASIWGMLGMRSPLLRTLPVIAVAGASGSVIALVIGRSQFTFWIIVTVVLESLFLLASLAVIRISGYRLMAYRSHSEQSEAAK